MEFRRITGLPPYVFTIIDTLKVEARRAGEDVIDLGFGNPDLPSPDIAVDKLVEAAQNQIDSGRSVGPSSRSVSTGATNATRSRARRRRSWIAS